MQNLLLSNTNQTAIGVTTRPGPSLDLNFAGSLNCIDQVSGRDLITFNRTTSGTYVDSAGVLRSAAVNLLLRSEEFENPTWTLTRLNPTISNAIIAPNGTLTSDKIVEDTTAASTHFTGQLVSGLTTATAYTMSVFLKAAERTSVVVRTSGTPFGNHGTFVDLSTGALGAIIGTLDAAPVVQSFGNGWYRVSITKTSTSGGSGGIVISTAIGATSLVNGDGISGLYLWGAQLETGSVATPYIPTTNAVNSAPRFDHNPTTLESLGLLVEEQRTNSIVNSNSITAVVTGSPGTLPTGFSAQGNNNGWTREVIGSGSIGALNYVDVRFFGTPTGTQFSFTFQSQGAVAASNGQSWSPSVYYQLVGGSMSNINSFPAANLWNSSVAFIGSLATSPGALTPTPTLQRFTATGTIGLAATAFISWGITFTNTAGSTYDFTIRFAGPQLEVGAFPTSYIPTTIAAVTRAADLASITGSNFGVTRTNLLSRSEEFENPSWVNSATTDIANAAIAPDGTFTADELIENNANTQHYLFQQTAKSATSNVYAFSAYVKRATSGSRNVLLALTDGATGGIGAVFDPDDGSVVLSSFVIGVGTGWAIVSPSPGVSVGNGWWRFSVVITSNTATRLDAIFYMANGSSVTYLGDNSSNLYLWGAQLETGSAATAYIPSPSTFVSRASSGTYFDSAGVLRSATTNLFLQSEDFGTSWSPVGLLAFGSGSTLNAIASPTERITADLIIENTASTQHNVNQSSTIVGLKKFSVFAKQGPGNRLLRLVDFNPTNGAQGESYFDLVTGTVVGGIGTIEAFANGWYRCSIQTTTTVTSSYFISLASSFNVFSYAGDGTSGMYIWGAQLEQSGTVGGYIPTTTTINSAPRFDHDPVSLISKGLLLEEQRTNLLLRSEELNDASWAQVFLSENVTANSIAAPNGLLVADRVATINATAEFGVGQSATVTANIPTTISIFAKAATSNFVYVRFYGGNTNLFYTIIVNLSTGIVTNTRTGPSTTAVSHSVIALSNGWYRISCTATHNSATQFLIAGPCLTGTQVIGATFGEVPTAGTGNESIYLYGAQLEAGAFATSYIPTTTAAVTRSADISTSAATTVFENSWYRQDQGTIVHRGNTTSAGSMYSLDDGTVNNRITSYMPSATAPFFFVQTLGTPVVNVGSSSITAGSTFTQASAYQADNFAVSVNGGAVGIDNSGAVPFVNKLIIGANIFQSGIINGTIRRITYYPIRIPNPLLQAITI